MATSAYNLKTIPLTISNKNSTSTVSLNPFFSIPFSSLTPFNCKPNKCVSFLRPQKSTYTVNAASQEPAVGAVVDTFSQFKHLLLPITDGNPYLSEGTRQAAATTAALAKKYGADITVVVIDEKEKESLPEHETQLSTGFQEFKMLERLGEGSKPTAIIGEVADEMDLDLVVMSMEAIHSKHVDANLLAEFIPCPVLLLPL